MAKAPDLFQPIVNFGGGSAAPIEDLFATPEVKASQNSQVSSPIAQRYASQATRPHRYKPPTEKELKQQAEYERNMIVGNVRQQLQSMQTSDAWTSSSASQRKELYDQWLEKKWKPMFGAIQDEELKDALRLLPQETLKTDLENYKKSIAAGSRMNDTWQGVKISTHNLARGFGDHLPAVYIQERIDKAREELARDNTPVMVNGIAQKMPDGEPLIYKIPAKDRAKIEARIVELEKDLIAQMKDMAETQKDIDAARGKQSIGEIDRDLEKEEDIKNHGGFLGVMANVAANPSNALQMAVEQLPTAAPVIASSLVAGPAGPAAVTTAASVSSAALSGQDAMSSAIEQVQQLSDKELRQLPEYQRLREQGLDEVTARNTLAFRAGKDALLLGAIVGLVTGGWGVEAGISRVLTGSAIKHAVKPDVAKTIGNKLATATGQLAVEGLEEGGTQLAANIAQNMATGGNTDVFNDVGRSIAEGIVASGPLSGTSATIDTVKTLRAGKSAPATMDGNSSATITVPTAEQAAATTSETAGSTANTTATTTAANSTSALMALRPLFQDINSRSGTTFGVDEANNFIDAVVAAEQNGAPVSNIESALSQIQRTVPPGLGYTNILDGYRQRRQASPSPVDMTAIDEDINNVTTESDNAESVSADAAIEPVTGIDNTSPATVDSINRAMETVADTSESTTTTVPEFVEQVSSDLENTGISRPERDINATDASYQGTTETMGIDPTPVRTDGRSINQSIPDSRQAISASERNNASETGQRPVDGRSTEGITDGTQGNNLNVGQIISYRGNFKGARKMTGTVSAVNPNGTFDLAVKKGKTSSIHSNLSTAGIIDSSSIPTTATASKNNIMDTESNVPRDTAPTALDESIPPSSQTDVPAQERGPNKNVGIKSTTPLGPINHGQEQRGMTQPINVADQAATNTLHGNNTASGYDVTRLIQRANQLADSNSEHAFAGLELAQALETGDLIKADELAQLLYEQGLRQFTPPQESTGRAAQTIDNVFLNTLSPAERLALQREYTTMSDTLPPEASSFTAFRDTAVQDQLLEDSGNAPTSNLLNRMSQIGRDIIKKIAKALAVVIAAITITHMVPINDATASVGQGAVQTVQQIQGLSHAANTVNAWVQDSRDNRGKPYIIADKESGEIHIVDASGNVKATAPALYGRDIGDAKQMGQTPAGIFTINQRDAPAAYGGDIQQFAATPKGEIYAIHRVLTNNNQGRPGRLASVTANDNRISLGCINIPTDIYNQYLSGKFDGKLYVLPDQRSLGEIFKGIDKQRAQQNLVEGKTLPEEFTAPTATEYESSTSTLAQSDFSQEQPGELKTSAAVTMAAQDADQSTATAFTAAQSNDAADNNLLFAAGVTFLAFLRNQRRAQRGKKGQSPDQWVSMSQPVQPLLPMGMALPQGPPSVPSKPSSVPPNQPSVPPEPSPVPPSQPSVPPNPPVSRDVANKDYHSIATILGPQANRVSNQPAQWSDFMSDFYHKAARKLSDSHHAFVTWVRQTGIVPKTEEFDNHPTITLLKSFSNRLRSQNESLTQQYMMPIYEHIVAIAQRMGREPDQVGQEMGSWQTFLHIPEANRALRQTLETGLNDVVLNGTPKEIQDAQDLLTALDEVQAGIRNIADLKKLGIGGLAAGLTDAQARAGIKIVENLGYRSEDLAEFRRLVRVLVDGLIQERIKSGTLSEEEAALWTSHGFTDYVPLYVHHAQKDAGNDVYLGTSNFNPAGDYTRHGSITPASHAMITLQQMLYRTAAGIESNSFKEALHAMYLTHKPAGLNRVNMNDVRLNPRSEYYSREIHDKRGFVYTIRDTNEVNEPVNTRYKYYFDDDTITEGLFNHAAEPDWNVLKPIAWATRTFGRLLTKYFPLFQPRTWWRDGGERLRTLASRKITDVDGNVIPAHRLYLGLMASLRNPIHVVYLGGYLFAGKFADTPTVKAYQEMQKLGAVSTYQHALVRSVSDMRSVLKSMKGFRKYAKNIDRYFTAHAEAWSAAAAVAGFIALRKMNVSAEQAAARSLDVMNATNKGEWHNNLSALYPFISPTFEGGRNLIRNLSTHRGRAIFGANILSGLALYSMLFTFAGMMFGEDDDGRNPLDAMSLDDLSMNIPLILGKDNIIKIPVAFGSSRLSWVLAAGLHRSVRGIDSPGKVVSAVTMSALKEMQPLEMKTNVVSDNIAAGVTLSVLPTMITPILELAMNINNFGNPIHSKAPREGFAADAARSTTPQIWSDIAQTLKNVTGIDAYPESIRHLSQAYMVGPLRGIITGLESTSLYMTGGKLTSRQQLGPFWDAIGVAQFWDNGSRGVSRTYYQYQEKADDILSKYGQLRTKAGTKSGDAANAAYRRVLEAGATQDEALLVRYAVLADKAHEKENREMRERVKAFKAKEYNLEDLAPYYEAHANKEEEQMRNFIRQARGLE